MCDFKENYILQMLGCLDDFMILSTILDYERLDDPKGIDGYYLSH